MKISNWQFAWMMATVQIGMTVWLTVAPAIREAKQDAWISMAVAGVAALAFTCIMVLLSRRYPSMTLVEFSQHIMGKWAGRAVCLLYFAGWYTVAAMILRGFSEFIQQTLFHKTPSLVISIIMVAAMVYINYKGRIEAIARFSEIVGPLLVLIIVITLLLNIPNLRLNLLLPVYADSGMVPIVKGSLTNASFLGESMMLMMITPFLIKPQHSLKPALLSIAVPSLLVILTTVSVIATFGTQMGGQLIYPYFNMVRFISFLDFVQNMDVWIIFVWIFCVFVKMSLYLFITSYGTAQFLNFRNRNALLVVVAVSLLLMSVAPRNALSVMDYANHVWIRYVFPINIIGLPLLMLIVARLRRV
ncbi:MAG: spore germination protein [Paenibacillus sp.]|jgi:spore germination protein KB|nr:spore germination protein [Paenibacillus sp.]